MAVGHILPQKSPPVTDARVQHPADHGHTMRQLAPINRTTEVRIGTAAWSIPRAAAFRFESAGTHLDRYSRVFRCAEVNSSFHRPHAAATYAKWRDSTPVDFRFAVKMPRTVTHELKLQDVRAPVVRFMDQTDGLAEKRGPILVQLPPSLSFDASVVTRFLDVVRKEYKGPIAFGGDADRTRARDAGFDEHATKPLDPGNLERLLNGSTRA